MYYGRNPWTEPDDDYEDEAYDDLGDQIFHERQDEKESRHED